MAKKLSIDYDTVLECLKDITLNNMTDSINIDNTSDAKDNKKRAINVQKFARYVIKSIFDSSIDSKDAEAYKQFVDSASMAIENFYDFLDYDDDGVVELVAHDENGKLIQGEDIELMINDASSFIYTFSANESLGKSIIVIMTQLTAFYTNVHITQSRQEFTDFKDECIKSYDALKKLNHINYTHLFTKNASSMIKFIINVCIAILPVADLVNRNIGISDIKSNIVITKYDIKTASDTMYGRDIEFILVCVDNLVNAITAGVAGSNKVKAFFTKCSTCCVTSTNTD